MCCVKGLHNKKRGIVNDESRLGKCMGYSKGGNRDESSILEITRKV